MLWPTILLEDWGRCRPHSKSREEPRWRPRGKSPLKAAKDLHLMVPKTVSRTDQNHVDGYALFHVRRSTKSQENSKRSKILNSQVSYQQKCTCFIFLAGPYFTNFKSKDPLSTLQHLSNFSKNVYSLQFHGRSPCLEVKNDYPKSSRLKGLSPPLDFSAP